MKTIPLLLTLVLTGPAFGQTHLPPPTKANAVAQVRSIAARQLQTADDEQLEVFPAEGKAVGYVEAKEPGKWVVLGKDFLPVDFKTVNDGAAVVFQAEGGTYGVLYFPPGDAQPRVARVVLGEVQPPEPPEPPEPPDPPTPKPGRRWLLIIHEAMETTFAEEQLFADLRHDASLSKHKLLIVDDDAQDENGDTVDGLEPWIRRAKDSPYLFILDDGGKVLYEGAVPEDKAAFLELLKENGG